MSVITAVPMWVWFVAFFAVTIVVMRLQNRRLRSPRRSKRDVEGIAHVVSVSEYGRRSGLSRGYCTMTLVLEAPGMQPATVRFKRTIAPKVWPTPGMTLPIFVNPARPKRYSIRWGEQPNPASEAAAQAAQLQSRLRAHGTYDSTPVANSARSVDPASTDSPEAGSARTINVSDLDPASRARVQSMLDDAHALLADAHGFRQGVAPGGSAKQSTRKSDDDES